MQQVARAVPNEVRKHVMVDHRDSSRWDVGPPLNVMGGLGVSALATPRGAQAYSMADLVTSRVSE